MKLIRNYCFIVFLSLIVLFVLSSTVMANPPFTDIPNNHWAKETIEWAIQEGMVDGYSDGTFRPNHFVTEAEFLTLLHKAYKSPAVDERYRPTVLRAKHWADEVYLFASEVLSR